MDNVERYKRALEVIAAHSRDKKAIDVAVKALHDYPPDAAVAGTPPDADDVLVAGVCKWLAQNTGAISTELTTESRARLLECLAASRASGTASEENSQYKLPKAESGTVSTPEGGGESQAVANGQSTHVVSPLISSNERAASGTEGSEAQGFYVASRASIPERAAMWRSFKESGAPITSSWIYEDGPGQTEDFGELWLRIMSEIGRSQKLVLYVEPDDFPLKGALIEVGIALGLGKPVTVVAPNVKLEGRAYRPLGSWVKHPNVTFANSVGEALAASRSGAGQKENENDAPQS